MIILNSMTKLFCHSHRLVLEELNFLFCYNQSLFVKENLYRQVDLNEMRLNLFHKDNSRYYRVIC